ncbi:MAG: undecaprenyl-diphosphate phosphatase [Nitrospirae bacterium]|nr:undecaprenyl-diphosphate phosphatase [Nitrospirota bacterium]
MSEAIILGVIQGLTEFLPVSSTAHLVILPWFFRWEGQLNSLTFDIALHAGTLAALLLCFWRDWADMALRKRRLLLLLILASVPAGIAGILLHDLVETGLRSPYIISAALVLGGIYMLISEKLLRHKKLDDISAMDALMIGLSQAVALVPGVSRSGITISTGLMRGVEREAAARFSFLLSTPVVGGAVVLHGRKVITEDLPYDLNMLLAGFAASAITGFVAIKFLMGFFKKHPLDIFVYYRFALAAFIIAGIWLRR